MPAARSPRPLSGPMQRPDGEAERSNSCGDTIRIQTEVLETRASKSSPTNGIVTFAHRAYNQDDKLVGECKRTALMLRKPA